LVIFWNGGLVLFLGGWVNKKLGLSGQNDQLFGKTIKFALPPKEMFGTRFWGLKTNENLLINFLAKQLLALFVFS
jgi:hypothetical protein